jgi:hypothetical protein
MPNDTRDPRAKTPPAYERPRFEVISLDCEITAYEGDDDRPLF